MYESEHNPKLYTRFKKKTFGHQWTLGLNVDMKFVSFSSTQGFFGGVPRWQKFCLSPQPTSIPTFRPEPVPPTWVMSPKISKLLPHFSLNFDYFLAQNCIRKLYFMLKAPNFAVGGIFGLSGQFFQVPPHLTSSPTWNENRPRKQVPPTKNFVKIPCYLFQTH